jgi:uncharacterized membrane protein YoaK (UPF0700 family)
MPLFYLRRLTGSRRSERSNRHLARYLALVAGAANAGGFLAVHQYTSHMSGVVSRMADDLAAGDTRLAMAGLMTLAAFLAGAFVTTLLIRWAHGRNLESRYAWPLVVEAGMLILFGFTGRVFRGETVLETVLLLAFTMGLQNAMITKISKSVIRTTHLTGMVTDIGIALGRMATSRRNGMPVSLSEETAKLTLLGSLVMLFFTGGVIGALGFKHVGFLFTLPLSAILLMLAAMPVIDDVRRLRVA